MKSSTYISSAIIFCAIMSLAYQHIDSLILPKAEKEASNAIERSRHCTTVD